MKRKKNEKKFKILSDRFVFREEIDGALIFNPETGNVKVLNNTGALIWKRCKNGATLSELVQMFKRKFNVDEKLITKDILKFLKELEKWKMLTKT